MTLPRVRRQERADDPAPAPTLSSDLWLPWRVTPLCVCSAAVHCTVNGLASGAPDPTGSPTGTLAPGASVSSSVPPTRILQSPVASSPGFVVLTVSMPDLIQPGGAVSIEPRPECRLTLKHQPMRLAKAALSTWFWGERLLMVSNDHGPNEKKQPYWIRWEATPVDWL